MRKIRRVALVLGSILAVIALLRAIGNRVSLPDPNASIVIKVMSILHRVLYRLTGGLVGGSFAGVPVLLLTTTGRKSGQQRTTPLLYLADGPDFVVVASNGGSDRHPSWWLNLQAQPDVEVQVRHDRLPVHGVRATPEEQRRLWPRLVQLYPDYATYRERTSREIPIVILRPRAKSGDHDGPD
jgi:F420H(2)-dependent quinone reductase